MNEVLACCGGPCHGTTEGKSRTTRHTPPSRSRQQLVQQLLILIVRTNMYEHELHLEYVQPKTYLLV